jgi:hypothetical protein
MHCCPSCFTDSFLNSRISAMSNKKGTCSFCKSKNVTLIPPKALTDYFNPLLEMYTKDSNGQPINKLIQNDWAIFSSPNPTQQKKLLNAISQNPNLSKINFVAKYSQDKANIEKWHSFTDELKHKNRFLPKGAPEKNLFIEFGPLLGVIIEKETQKFYRARINEDGKQFKLREMKKPPAKKVQNGRANPLGIPYLYVASTAETAIAEVRGHKGESVTVLEFNAKRNLELFDLRDPRNTISPFESLDDIEFIYAHMPYLILLEEELSKPVIPSKADLEYLSSQYLCEMIKQIGYHGIIYKSSIADGNNYVIFADKRLSTGTMNQYSITEMKFETKLIP